MKIIPLDNNGLQKEIKNFSKNKKNDIEKFGGEITFLDGDILAYRQQQFSSLNDLKLEGFRKNAIRQQFDNYIAKGFDGEIRTYKDGDYKFENNKWNKIYPVSKDKLDKKYNHFIGEVNGEGVNKEGTKAHLLVAFEELGKYINLPSNLPKVSIEVDPELGEGMAFYHNNKIILTPSENNTLTILHELIHHLDFNKVFSKGEGVGYDSQSSKIFDDFLKITTQTPEYQHLLKENNYEVDNDESPISYPETWSRAVVQYILTRNNNPWFNKEYSKTIDPIHPKVLFWWKDNFSKMIPEIHNILNKTK